MMLSEGIHLIGDGLLDVAEEKLNGLLVQDDINEIYDIEQAPFARGKFAAVRRAIHKKSGVHFAAKFLKRRRRAQSSDKEIKHEIAVLILCSGSDNIVKLNAVHESTSDTALLLELATGGELQAFLDNEGSLTEAQTRICMKEVLKALQFLHKKSIAHLDLKPQNILLTGPRIEDGLKLCDFGISRVIEHGSKVREILGTPDYVAPEVLQYEPLSLQTDMWSVGVLTYVLLTGCSPFAGDTKQETFLNISQCDLTFPEDLFDGVSEQAIDFIKSTLRIKPNDRLTASDCLDHIWLKDEFPVDDKRFYNISMASDGVSSDPDENLDDFDDEDDDDDHHHHHHHHNKTTTNCCNTNNQRKSNGCTSKFLNGLNLTNGRTNTTTHRYKKLNDHDHHHNQQQQQQQQQQQNHSSSNNDDDDDDYNKENFLINSSEIVVLINNSVNGSNNIINSSPTSNNISTNLIKTNRCSRDNNSSCYNNSLNGSNTINSPNILINLDKNNCSSTSINTTLNSSCSSSSTSSISSIIANSAATINNITTATTTTTNNIITPSQSTILFPDAPTTPKVIRKAPSSESPTSVKALVKKFQLESGEPLTTPSLLKDTSPSSSTTQNHHHDENVILIENTNNSTNNDGLKFNNRNINNSTTINNSTNNTTTTDNNSSYKTSCVFCLTCGGPGCRHPSSNSNSVVNSNKTSTSLGLDQGIIC